ncbi:MAG: NAD(P)-dependent oxidoreductase [Bacteroidales bacterium]
MIRGKILFIDTANPLLREELEKMGFQCDHFPDANKDELIRIASEYVGFIIRSKIPLDDNILPKAHKLKFIARVGAGMENIDVPLAEKLGIVCLNAPEGNRDAVAEHAIGMLLALLNHLMRVDTEVRNGIWIREGNRGLEIMGKTVAIIGFGNTGSSFARKLSGFGADIIAYDKYKTGFGTDFVREVQMDEVFEKADILSFHVPLADDTSYLFDKSYIEKFQKPFFLINTSRGKVVRTSDLVEALESGKVRGACLDVLEYEKFSFEAIQSDQLPEAFRKLISMQNVILSPHIAGWTHESNRKMAEVLVQKIREITS